MKKSLADCQCFILHFDSKYDVEVFGSITEIVDYLKENFSVSGEIPKESKKIIRLKVINAIENYKDFTLHYEYESNHKYHRDFFVSKHKMKIECRLHS